MSLGIAFCLVSSSIAQEPGSTSDVSGIASVGKSVVHCGELAPATLADSNGDPNADADGASCESSPMESAFPSPNAIMGFESPVTWRVTTTGFTPHFQVMSTTMRTQGRAALDVVNPPKTMLLTSLPVNSLASSLAGIGNKGAVLQVDVLATLRNTVLSNEMDQPDTTAGGTIEAFISSQSRGLNKVSLGQALFSKYKAGTYGTIGFSIPESITSALHDAKFTDLIFQFVVTSGEDVPASYFFDNLRVHSVELVQHPTGSAPPSGYGGSANLVVLGNKQVEQTFTLGPTQIPAGFHLKTGTVGETIVQLQLGLDASPTLTCSYYPDASDKTDQSYALKSCTGSYKAGDLVSANWASLVIEEGNSSQQIHAQLALSPLGDQTGSGLLPPMPTFWGEADTCSPAPVAGKVVTKSQSCSSQVAQASTIITNYFNQVKDANPSSNWIVAPVPESATRLGNGAPIKKVAGAPTDANQPLDTPANDTTFDTGGDLNPGGSFDAYWSLSGNLIPTAVTGTDENLTHFDATFTAHGVLFGEDLDVADAKLTADTDSGETTPTYKPATSSGTLGFYVFGEEIPSGGITFTPSTGFSVDPSWTQEFDLPPIQIWIFDITLGALVDADLNASGSAALSGADLSVIPTASLGGHISGGINIGIAQGDVDAKVNLVSLSAPMTAQAKFVLNTSPAVCATTLNGELNGNLNISSGGGQVDLDATFGICPFCYTDSWTLFKWGALASQSWNLFNDTLSYQAFGLPASLCPLPITVNIASPVAGASLSSAIPYTLNGLAAPTDPSVPYTSTYKWTFTPGANASNVTVNPNGATSANPSVVFGAPKSGNTSTWTINLTATTTVQSQGGAVLTKTASATPVTITVTNLQPGDYITQVSSNNGIANQDSNGVYQLGNVPQNITINGTVAGASGGSNTVFSLQYCNDDTPACSDPVAPQFSTITTNGGNTASPTATMGNFSGGYFKITMYTTSGEAVFGDTSVIVFGTVLL